MRVYEQAMISTRIYVCSLQHTQQEATISNVQYTRGQISYYEHSEEIFQQIRTVKTQTVV
jgi:hypothetical protein